MGKISATKECVKDVLGIENLRIPEYQRPYRWDETNVRQLLEDIINSFLSGKKRSTDFGVRFPKVRQYTTQPSRFAKAGDILMSVRAPVGATNFASQDCCIGRGLSAINSKIGSITYVYEVISYFKT